MEQTFNDVFLSKIEFANYHKLTRFIFVYRLEYYMSEWKKGKWSEPIKVKFL